MLEKAHGYDKSTKYFYHSAGQNAISFRWEGMGTLPYKKISNIIYTQ